MVLRRANCKRFTHIRPTDGSGSRPVSWSGERLSMAVHGQTRMPNAPAVSKSLVLFLLLLEFSLKQNNSTVNCQKLRSFPESSRLETDCITSKLTRMSNVRALFRIRPKNMRLTSHCRAEYRAGTPCDSFCFPQRTANHRALESDAWP